MSAAAASRRKHQKRYVYNFDLEIAKACGLNEKAAIPSGHVMTNDNRGYQMQTLSPLYSNWVEGKMKDYPLLDIGCAFGMNTLTAVLRDNCNVIAVDMDEKHIKYCQMAYEKGKQLNTPLMKAVLSKLPDLENVENNSIGSILCAEVLHFLNGHELKQSFQRFYQVLVEGGTLNITCGSHYAFDWKKIRELVEKKKNGSNNDFDADFPAYITGEEMEEVLYKYRDQWEKEHLKPEEIIPDDVKKASICALIRRVLEMVDVW